MKENVRTILDSDLLEKYLMGTATHEETLQAESYISTYPEIKKAYDDLQENLEAFARLHAVDVPDGLESRIMDSIRNEKKGTGRFAKFAIAASFALMVSAGASYFFWSQDEEALLEKNTIVNSNPDARQDEMREQLEDVRNQFIVLQNPETKKYEVTGNKKAKELKAVAYVNPVKKLSYLNVSSLPHLPEDQCYQMWAEVNGEMLNLGVIREAEQKLLALPYSDNAVGYITIEPEGGNDRPTVENIVANITY